jgi:hypothetical protein
MSAPRARRPLRVTGYSIVLAALLSGCAKVEPGVRADPTNTSATTFPLESPSIDWARPQPANTVEVAGLSEAAGVLPFVPISPKFGEPLSVFVSDPDQTPDEDRVLFLVYKGEDGNPFWVVQLSAGPNWKDNFDQQVAECIPPTCSGLSVVQVRDKQRALLSSGDFVTALLWLEGDVEVRLQGPSASFNSDVAILTANSL